MSSSHETSHFTEIRFLAKLIVAVRSADYYIKTFSLYTLMRPVILSLETH